MAASCRNLCRHQVIYRGILCPSPSHHHYDGCRGKDGRSPLALTAYGMEVVFFSCVGATSHLVGLPLASARGVGTPHRDETPAASFFERRGKNFASVTLHTWDSTKTNIQIRLLSRPCPGILPDLRQVLYERQLSIVANLKVVFIFDFGGATKKQVTKSLVLNMCAHAIVRRRGNDHRWLCHTTETRFGSSVRASDVVKCPCV